MVLGDGELGDLVILIVDCICRLCRIHIGFG